MLVMECDKRPHVWLEATAANLMSCNSGGLRWQNIGGDEPICCFSECYGKTMKELPDGRTLADYNIQKESTLHLVLRLRGGTKQRKKKTGCGGTKPKKIRHRFCSVMKKNDHRAGARFHYGIVWQIGRIG